MTLVRPIIAAIALTIVAGCTALEEPGGNIGAISTLQVPSPSIVLGDVMRDSTGAPAPVRVIVYDRRGAPIEGAAVTYLSLDPSVSVDASGQLSGLTLDPEGARIVGGIDNLQTAPVRVFVTVAPTGAAATSTGGSILFTPLTDTTNNTNWSDTLGVRVTGAGGAGAQGFVVDYTIERAPTQTGTRPAVYLADPATQRASTRDTTSASGYASRRLILRQTAVGDAALLSGTKVDTIAVRATVRYGGVDIPGSPLTFLVPVRRR